MITIAHITRRAQNEGVSAQVIERDYALTHAVSAIARYDSDRALVFKGGTSLRLFHIANYRYSADLDFSLRAGTKEQAINLLDGAFRSYGEGLPQLTLDRESDHLRVLYTGPLGRERPLKLDLATDELVVNIEHVQIRSTWEDVPSATMTVYTPLEIAGEKLRCILQRLQCRDLYDLYILLCVEQVDPADAVELFCQKSRHIGLDPGTFGARYQYQILRYRERWTSELQNYMNIVPPFGEVERRVRRVLRQANLV